MKTGRSSSSNGGRAMVSSSAGRWQWLVAGLLAHTQEAGAVKTMMNSGGGEEIRKETEMKKKKRIKKNREK